MATWAKGLDFQNSKNTASIGGIGIYGTDTAAEKIYLAVGTDPWLNKGLEITTTTIKYKNNKVYHAGDKPTLTELGAAAASHTHSYDNYGKWVLKVNSDGGTNITTGTAVDIKGAGATTVARSGNTITITSTDTNTMRTLATATTALVAGGTGTVGTSSNVARQDHTHTLPAYPTIPSSLPANGGNSDTVDNLHASAFGRAYSTSYNFGGNQTDITTADFLTLLDGLGAFRQAYWVARGSWSYANNRIISDTGCGRIHLAGSVVEVMGGSKSVCTVRITTPTTSSGGTTHTEYIYVTNGDSYSPGWRKVWNDKNDGSGSGLDADLLDGKHAADFSLTSHTHSNYSPTSHTHNYAGSSSAGGAATSALTCTGNSATASKWATARVLSLTGAVTGSVSIDGSGNMSMTTTGGDITTITKSITLTTVWQDTGIAGTNIATGSYMVQVTLNDPAYTGASQYNEIYTGVMSWFSSNTNNTDTDEILLHKAGHSSNGQHLYLRTARRTSSTMSLQVAFSKTNSTASSIQFKFKKLI